MVTVKKASTVLGLDKNIIRDLLDSGVIKGERRVVGSKEKWFLYHSEVQELLDKRIPHLVEQAERTTLEGLTEFFDETATLSDITEESMAVSEVTDEELDNPDRLLPQLAEPSIDQVLHSLTVEFSYRLCEERQRVFKLEQDLQEKEELLKRLPDLEKHLNQERYSVFKLEQELLHREEVLRRLPDLEKDLDEERSSLATKSTEIASLRSRVSDLEGQLMWWQKPWWARLFGTQPQPA